MRSAHCGSILCPVVSDPAPIRFDSSRGRWVIATAVLGSGIAFLDGTVVNTALPAIQSDLHTSLAGQQWILTGYLLTLGSLLVLGGSLGDLFGRRRLFVYGLVGFSITSMLCGLAPNLGVLIAARVLQGVSAAALVPGSLAMLSAVFHPDDRAKAIGAWSGLATVATALGPFLGGWLIDAVSWRWVFFINVPLAVVAVIIALRYVPETRASSTSGAVASSIDGPGAFTLSVGLGGVVFALIEGPGNRWGMVAIAAAVVGAASLVAFAVIETRSLHPMVPLSMFRSRRFAGANAVTFVVWGALGAVFFLLAVHLQNDLGYSALESGAALLPVTVIMMLFSAKSGALSQRIGPRLPMTVGPLLVAVGFALMTRVAPGQGYVRVVLPAVLVFASGLVITVAPLNVTVLAAVEDGRAGVGSAINNAVARVASLLAIAVLPALAGIAGSANGFISDGFSRAMWICVGLAVFGAIISALTIVNSPVKQPVKQPVNIST